MARIAIVGAGQGGLHLAIGLAKHDHDVTLVSNRSATDILAGSVTSSQFMFGQALGFERDLGIDFWQHEGPKCKDVSVRIADSGGDIMTRWFGVLDTPGQSIDQRLKMPRWMDYFEACGGRIEIEDADISTLERLTLANDLVIVATGKGEICRLFPRNAERSTYTQPSRSLALGYVKTLRPTEGGPRLSLNINPGVGEMVTFPGTSLGGDCEVFTIEAVPGGPMDCWDAVRTPQEHIELCEALIRQHFPLEAERIDGRLELIDQQAVLRGRLTPTVRDPVGELPSGRFVLGLGDVLVLNDPITGQGANNASRCAQTYLEEIDRNSSAFDREWAESVFDKYWDNARWVVEFTNMALNPPPYMMEIFQAAQGSAQLSNVLANSFSDLSILSDWYFEERKAKEFVKNICVQAA